MLIPPIVPDSLGLPNSCPDWLAAFSITNPPSAEVGCDKNLKSSCKIYLEYSKFTDLVIPDSVTILKEKSVGDVKALLLCINEN